MSLQTVIEAIYMYIIVFDYVDLKYIPVCSQLNYNYNYFFYFQELLLNGLCTPKPGFTRQTLPAAMAIR